MQVPSETLKTLSRIITSMGLICSDGLFGTIKFAGSAEFLSHDFINLTLLQISYS